MADKSLIDFVKSSLDKGYSETRIRDSLIEADWDREDIGQVFDELKKDKENLPPLKPPSPHLKNNLDINIDIKALSASQILLFLGGLITVLGAVIYIALNWSSWNAFSRILAIALPLLFLYTTGISMHFGKKYQTQSIFFITTASLILPLFLYVFFKELNFLGPSSDFRSLLISVITLIAYLTSAFYLPSPVWTVLSPVTGMSVLYYFLSYFQINFFGQNTKFWFFLLLGFVYTVIGVFYEIIKKTTYSQAIFILGIGLSLFMTVALTFSHPLDSEKTWYLFIPAACYFLTAFYLETSTNLEKTSFVYFLSLFTFFITTLKLTVGGQFLTLFNIPIDETSIYWSFVLLGIFYLGLSFIFQDLKHKLPSLSKFYVFFELIGTLIFLGGLFRLSLNGKKMVIETSLLLSSLGFIFGSIFRQSKSFLYLGTLFLVIYIFDIGGEYFYNQVGWPITLFIAGILSMLVGFGIEKIRRNYFSKIVRPS